MKRKFSTPAPIIGYIGRAYASNPVEIEKLMGFELGTLARFEEERENRPDALWAVQPGLIDCTAEDSKEALASRVLLRAHGAKVRIRHTSAPSTRTR